MLARWFDVSGIASLSRRLNGTDHLLVLNYHRIGNPGADGFDPGLFSATSDDFEGQVALLKREFDVVNLEEAEAFVHRRLPKERGRCRILITFDDGYRDCYQLAYPILRSYGISALFFLPTHFVGSHQIPWWDQIAFYLRTARRRRFVLKRPAMLEVDLAANGLQASLRKVLALYKSPSNLDGMQLIEDVRENAQPDELPQSVRRFVDWNEAREMVAGGMAIGSHGHSHTVLSQLHDTEQQSEMTRSYQILSDHLKTPPRAVAYPVGRRRSFGAAAKQAARSAGYTMGFSFYGGTNYISSVDPFDIKRSPMFFQSPVRLRVQIGICSLSGTLWP